MSVASSATMARSAPGVSDRIAIWIELNPPQEMPHIPTAPVHHGWAASHEMTASPSAHS
jgi:hypothetical protein